MKFLITGDLHLNAKRRDAYRHDFIHWLQNLAWRHRVDRIIVLGDLTEDKDRHPAWLVNKVVEHFKRLVRVSPVTIERGNHDYRDIESPFFEFLGKFEGIKWIGDPDSHHLPGVLFLPHTRNYKNWAIDFSKFGWIFTHNTFEGAKDEGGRPMRGIPLSVFPPGPVVISGDVHVPQTLSPVIYVGAPYTINFGDKFQPRVLLIEGKKITSISCPGPRKRLVEIAWPALGADERILDQALKRVNSKDLVKVRVKLEDGQYDHWQEIYDTVMGWAHRKQLEMCAVTPELMEGGNRPALVKRARRSDDDLMKEYVKRQNADDRTLKTGRNLSVR